MLRRAGRSSIVRVALAIVLIVLALILLWHLFGMIHAEGMGILGGCLFVLVAAFVLAAPRMARRVLLVARLIPRRGWIASTEPVSRAPPGLDSLEGVVLIC